MGSSCSIQYANPCVKLPLTSAQNPDQCPQSMSKVTYHITIFQTLYSSITSSNCQQKCLYQAQLSLPRIFLTFPELCVGQQHGFYDRVVCSWLSLYGQQTEHLAQTICKQNTVKINAKSVSFLACLCIDVQFKINLPSTRTHTCAISSLGHKSKK